MVPTGVGEERRRPGDWVGQGALLDVRWVHKEMAKVMVNSNWPERLRAGCI